MLAPDQRALLLEALKPPEKYALDRALATTFTLDLLTLLIAPLSFALYEFSESDRVLQDPVLLMEGLERSAEKLAVFCQAGAIGIPKKHSYLFSYLEGSVVEVTAPGGGVFHPKTWLLRYTADEYPPIYRFLNLTRNLTFDRSWDLMLRLEGELADRTNAYARNHPLGDFYESLPEMALNPVPDRIQSDLDIMQDEVRRVDFDVPEPFFDDDLSFHPIGHRPHRGLPLELKPGRKLIVSPFLTGPALKMVSKHGQDNVLISTPASVGALDDEVRGQFSEIFVLDDGAIPLTGEEDSFEEQTAAEVPDREGEWGTEGLHAKLLVTKDGWDARWYIGSANATDAALRGHNVEFMVGLKGRDSKVGIDAILGDEDEENTLRALLVPYIHSADEEPNGGNELAAEKAADEVRRWLATSGLTGVIAQEADDRFGLSLRALANSEPDLSGGVEAKCWLISTGQDRGIDAIPLLNGSEVNFANLSLLALTTFVAFEISATVVQATHTTRFVMNVPLIGLPDRRGDRIIREILSDRSRFLQYLRLILAEEDSVFVDSLLADSASDGQWWARGLGDDQPLFEAMMRALSRSPEKIDRVSYIVERLQESGNSAEVLPEGFHSLWEAVRDAREAQS